MIIEFTGLPGSGKTTVANKLIGKVNVWRGTFDHFGRIRRTGSKLSTAFTSFLFLPKDSCVVVKELFINHNSNKEIGRDVLNILYLMARYHKAKKDRETIYIFDQGLIQAFLSSCTYGQWSERIFELLKKYLDRVILVDVAPEVSAGRLSERADQSSRSQKQTDTIQHLKEQKEILNRIMEKLDLPDDKYLTIQNDVEMNTRQIDQIKSWLFNEE